MSNCAKCKKFVAMPEERRACSKVFHIDCFTCGSLDPSAGGCGKKLTLDSYTDSKGIPFCKVCYGRLFGPKGFSTGSATFNSFDESSRNTISGPTATTAARTSPSREPAPTQQSSVYSNNPSPRPNDGRIVNDRNARVMDTEIVPKAESMHGLRSTFSGSTAKSCAKCTKSVSLAEERLACNQTWHIDCFVCGGKQSNGCRKKLTLQSYTSHDNDPYCTNCYNKLFGARGFVGGSSAISTFNNNASSNTSSVTDSHSVNKNTSSPPRSTAAPAPTAAVSSNNSSPRGIPPPPPPKPAKTHSGNSSPTHTQPNNTNSNNSNHTTNYAQAPHSVQKGNSASSGVQQHQEGVYTNIPQDRPNDGRLINDRNAPAIQGEAKLMPKAGSVRAAMEALKKELPKA